MPDACPSSSTPVPGGCLAKGNSRVQGLSKSKHEATPGAPMAPCGSTWRTRRRSLAPPSLGMSRGVFFACSKKPSSIEGKQLAVSTLVVCWPHHPQLQSHRRHGKSMTPAARRPELRCSCMKFRTTTLLGLDNQDRCGGAPQASRPSASPRPTRHAQTKEAAIENAPFI